MSSDNPIRIIRLGEVKRRTGLSTSTLYALMARDEFPRQVGLGSGAAVGCVESEIDNYLAERIRHRDIAWQRLGDVASRVAEKVKSTE